MILSMTWVQLEPFLAVAFFCWPLALADVSASVEAAQRSAA
jgi:hypothetical protein